MSTPPTLTEIGDHMAYIASVDIKGPYLFLFPFMGINFCISLLTHDVDFINHSCSSSVWVQHKQHFHFHIFYFLGWKSMWNCCYSLSFSLYSHDEYVASMKCWRIHFSFTTIDHLSKSENAFSIFFSPSSSAYLSAAAACCLLSVFVYLSMIFELLESIMFLVD